MVLKKMLKRRKEKLEAKKEKQEPEPEVEVETETETEAEVEETSEEIQKLEKELETLNYQLSALRQQNQLENESFYRYNLLATLNELVQSLKDHQETLRNGINAIGSLLSEEEEDAEE